MPAFERIPSLAIAKGRPVVPPTGGGTGWERVDDADGNSLPPQDILKQLFKGHGKVLLTDVDGVESGQPQWQLLKKLCATGACWVRAGLPADDGVVDLFMAGADAVILSTSTIPAYDAFADAMSISDRLVFGIDYDGARNRVLGSKGDEPEPATVIAQRAVDDGAMALLLNDRARSPLAGTKRDLVGGIADLNPLYLEGPGETDVRPLRRLKVAGVVVDLLQVIAPVGDAPAAAGAATPLKDSDTRRPRAEG